MYAIASLLVIVAVSLVVTRVATVMLTRGDEYFGTPHCGTRVEPGDTLVLYGRADDVAELDCRPAGPEGDRLHKDAVARQDERELTAASAS